jgi:hypothetical protein
MSWMNIEFDSLYVYHPNMESHITLHGVVNKGEEVFWVTVIHTHLNQGTHIMLMTTYVIAMVDECSHYVAWATIGIVLAWFLVMHVMD